MEAELIILDFDGTLADSSKSIIASFRHTLKKMGVQGVKSEKIRALIGTPLEKMFELLVPSESRRIEEFTAEYRRHYGENAPKNTKLFPRVKETLAELKKRGKKLVIATTKRKFITMPIIDSLGITGLFDLVLGSEDVKEQKPAPEMILLALEKTGTVPEKAVMVGDTAADILAAKAARVKSIGVSYGIGSAAELKEAGADLVIGDFSELQETLEK